MQCPHYSGCPYFRGVRKATFHCMHTRPTFFNKGMERIQWVWPLVKCTLNLLTPYCLFWERTDSLFMYLKWSGYMYIHLFSKYLLNIHVHLHKLMLVYAHTCTCTSSLQRLAKIGNSVMFTREKMAKPTSHDACFFEEYQWE